MEQATFAGGCFWCTEAIFQRLKGVTAVISGFTGGNIEDPSYEQVTSGKTGHAEAIQIIFDPNIITYQTLLEVFWATHNPTTKNQQDADIGTQYRSAIFYHTQEQKQIAEISQQKAQQKYTQPIVTEIVPFTKFYPAESYHQDFYNKNNYSPYCQIVIDPKVQKLLKEFSKQIKEEYKQA